jgi:uncharacterized protein (DUF488 family)
VTSPAAGGTTLFTIGHGTLAAERFAALLHDAGVALLVDVRTAPGSRRHPHFARGAMELWVPDSGVAYRWVPELGGFRKPRADSVNLGLRHPSFRGYADHMQSGEFSRALDGVLEEAARRSTAVMCSESLWWRCHRRLIADAAVLTRGVAVLHLLHDGHREEHRPTEGAATVDGRVTYPVG